MLTREDPAAAMRELERWAGDAHFVQASTMPHGLEPLGRERYWPIFEAVEAAGLPLGIHVGGASAMAPTSTGWPSFYIEEHHSKCEAMQALMVSLVVEGVFERCPKLKVVLIEGGFVWVPSLAWRLDKTYKRLKAEAPHLKRLPSEYIRDHFWYTTQPIEEPQNPQDLADVMEWVGWDRILFSTDYPHWDFDDPQVAIKTRLNDAQRRMIFHDNAAQLYGLS
jgi:predicted TIM-barrel fold metal-dependent hydrolase